MKDFQPDYFSLTPTTEKTCDLLKSEVALDDILKNYKFLESITRITRISDYGVNSQNIKIESQGQFYVLKFWSRIDTNRINEICETLNYVSADGINVPIPIRNHDSIYTSIIEKQIATLFLYIEGSVFLPTLTDLPNYFYEVSNLFESLKNIGLTKDISPKLLDTESMSVSIINLCNNKNSYFFDNFSESMDVLTEIKSQLLKSLKVYSQKATNTQIQFSHYDLHPKNILQLPKNNYAFLDFESCDVYDSNLAWGFTLVKILRQALVGSQDLKLPAKVGSGSLDLIKKLTFAERLHVDFLPDFGRAEIIRRLVYIVKAYEDSKSTEWISMFPVQIQLLRESLIMFDQWE